MIWSEKVGQLFVEIERGASAMWIDGAITERKRRMLVDRVAVSMVLLSMLAACSSASSIDSSADAYPSQSLGDFLRRTNAQSPTNASTATNSSATNSPAAASASSIDSAVAYPSQSIGDFLRRTDAPSPTNASTATNSSATNSSAAVSASSVDYAAVAYPSQSIGDFLRRTDAQSPTNASTATNSSAAAANASIVAAPPNAGGSPPGEDFDPLTAAYPSVPLSEIFSSSTKPAPR